MKFSLVFLVVLACVALTVATTAPAPKKQQAALQKACKQAAGGTKIKLEIDLGQGCFGRCRGKKTKKAAPVVVKKQGKPNGNALPAAAAAPKPAGGPPAGPPPAKPAGGPPAGPPPAKK